MRNVLAVFALFASLTLAGQQKRIIIGGGGDPDATKDWPKPQIKAGLTQEQAVAAAADYGQALAGTDHFSGSLLVAKEGKTLLSRAWGMAGPAEKNTVDTKFNIGSINKIFTKAAIEGLAKEGKFSLDDTIRKRLPDYPSPVADRITIQQLLDHRSGLGDFFGPKYRNAPPSRLRELPDFLPLFADQPLEFEPGSSQRYSNAGYLVLGLIIERVSGQKYRDYIQEHVFAPAGMTNSGFWAVDEEVPNRATGYTMLGPDGPLTKRADNRPSLPGRPSSAGGAYSTAGDLLKFVQWLHVKWMGIGGGAPGLNASIEVNDGWTVIAMSNYDPPSAEELAHGAMQIVRGQKDDPEARMPPGGAKQIIRN